MSGSFIQIKDLYKTFGDHDVLKGINLEVKKGEVVSIIGSSGSGKSTIINLIERFYDVSKGEIFYKGI